MLNPLVEAIDEILYMLSGFRHKVGAVDCLHKATVVSVLLFLNVILV